MKRYIILSLNDSTKSKPIFWRSNNAGYTSNPWQAGIYSEEEVRNDPGYYNNGVDTIAICVDNSTVSISGLKFSLNAKEAKAYRTKNLGQL